MVDALKWEDGAGDAKCVACGESSLLSKYSPTLFARLEVVAKPCWYETFMNRGCPR
jgi:hypothetical protein